MARRLIGTSTTNSQGVATCDYTGVGAGEIDIVATSGSLVSEIFSIIDALYFEDGTSDKSANWTLNNVTYSSNGESVTLNNTSGGSRWSILKIDNSTSYLDSSLDYCIEVDIKNVNATNITLILDNSGVNVYNYVNTSDFTSIKIYTSRNENKVYYVIDEVVRSVNMATSNGNIQFRLSNNESYSFKNLKVYPI